MAVSLSQASFRFGSNDGTESTHGWLAAQDADLSLAPATTFLLRVLIQETGGTAIANVDFEFQYNKNAAGWNNITTTSAVCKAVASTPLTDGGDSTNRLGGTGAFDATNACQTEVGDCGGTKNDCAASGKMEAVCSMQIVDADVAHGDTVDFRLTRDGGTLLEVYAVTPTITVLKTVTLVVADAGHVHGAETFALTQHNVLAAQDGTSSQAAESPALTQHNVLAVQGADHVHAGDEPVLVYHAPTTPIVIQDGQHAQAADPLVLVQHGILATADGLHTHISGSPVLTQHNVLYSQDTVHDQTGDPLSLTQHSVIAVQDAAHAQTADPLSLVQHGVLVAQDAAHAQSADGLSLIAHDPGAVVLAVEDGQHGHAADSPALIEHAAVPPIPPAATRQVSGGGGGAGWIMRQIFPAPWPEVRTVLEIHRATHAVLSLPADLAILPPARLDMPRRTHGHASGVLRLAFHPGLLVDRGTYRIDSAVAVLRQHNFLRTSSIFDPAVSRPRLDVHRSTLESSDSVAGDYERLLEIVSVSSGELDD